MGIRTILIWPPRVSYGIYFMGALGNLMTVLWQESAVLLEGAPPPTSCWLLIVSTKSSPVLVQRYSEYTCFCLAACWRRNHTRTANEYTGWTKISHQRFRRPGMTISTWHVECYILLAHEIFIITHLHPRGRKYNAIWIDKPLLHAH